MKSGVKRHPQYKATLNRTTLLRLFFTEKKSAPDMRVLFIIATVSVLIPAFAEASLQCVSCTGGSCETSNPKTEDCDEKCYTMELRKKSPDEEDPFVVKGCTSDSLFWRRSCVNKCYDSKKEFGSSLYYNVRSLLLRRQMQLLFTSKGWNNHGCRVRCYCSCQISVLLEGGNKSITVLD